MTVEDVLKSHAPGLYFCHRRHCAFAYKNRGMADLTFDFTFHATAGAHSQATRGSSQASRSTLLRSSSMYANDSFSKSTKYFTVIKQSSKGRGKRPNCIIRFFCRLIRKDAAFSEREWNTGLHAVAIIVTRFFRTLILLCTRVSVH